MSSLRSEIQGYFPTFQSDFVNYHDFNRNASVPEKNPNSDAQTLKHITSFFICIYTRSRRSHTGGARQASRTRHKKIALGL
jgi:hypothetical protein